MSRTVIQIDGHQAYHVKNLRSIKHGTNSVAERATASFLADAIDAAQGKRYVVLDVDELNLGQYSENPVWTLRNTAQQQATYTAEKVLDAVADQLDALTPPRPPEPTGLGVVVEDRQGKRYVRFRPDGGPAKWALATNEPVNIATMWSSIDVVAVLSPGVGGEQ